ncbi:hypothetical protein TELCIR_23168 [Teladorsagia circumcincta]|uniref:Reverse transcriptase domain-containing protein n=1 Tax=Teladorsagia circumcincta TaxID=45464 RepID=A0A2G9TBY4_TELCI|nr:hypothetical protein TELCIR_23168 [Teladorsagia circumcincta]
MKILDPYLRSTCIVGFTAFTEYLLGNRSTAGLEGTAAYLDDIIVTGTTIDEHNTRLKALFQRIHEYGFRVRLEKCSFLQTGICYLGFIINADGRRPDPSKIEAVRKMPPPRDATKLRAFLGLINCYGASVKELHDIRVALDALTKKMLATHSHRSVSHPLTR